MPLPIHFLRPRSLGALTLASLALAGCLAAHREPVPAKDGGGTGVGVGSTSCVAVEPQGIDFGIAVVGSAIARTVSITNRCGAPVGATIGELTGPEAQLFTLEPSPGTVLTLADQGSQSLTVQYQPVTASPTPAQASLSIDLCDAATGCHPQVALQGTAIAFGLVVSPDALNFGSVQPQEVATRYFTLASTANTTIHLLKDPFVSNSTANGQSTSGPFQLGAGFPTTGTAIPPGQSVQVPVVFSPTSIVLFDGELDLATDDPQSARLVLHITGFGGGAKISCTPVSFLDFGFNALGVATVLSVLCTNAGTDVPGHPEASLFLPDPNASPPGEALRLQDGDPAFRAVFDQPFPAAGLPAGGSTQIDVTYAATDAGANHDTLILSSNDAENPGTRIDVKGTTLVLPSCDYRLSAYGGVAFGHIAVGTVAVLPFEIFNQGTDDCLLKTPTLLGSSDGSFSLPGYPPGENRDQIVPAGSWVDVDVQFAPTAPSDTVFGAVDISVPNALVPNLSVGLSGSSLAGCLVGRLDPIDFGVVGFDPLKGSYCQTDWREVTVWNICADQDVKLTSVELLDPATPAQFSLGTDPTPFTLPRTCDLTHYCAPINDSVTFRVAFTPSRLGTSRGGLRIATDDPQHPYLVTFKGKAAQGTTQTDSFTGHTAKVDLLWVLDVTHSNAAADQQDLIGNLPAFLADPIQNGMDLHIATTSTNVYSLNGAEDGKMEPCPGCQVDGSSLQVVTGAGGVQAAVNSLAPLLTQGTEIGCYAASCNGFGDTSQMLEATYEALSPTLLGGYNQAFYRSDASLAVIMVNGNSSDDLSNAHPVSFYYDALVALKGNASLLSLSQVTRFGTSDTLPRLAGLTGGVTVDLANTGTPGWTDGLNALWTKLGAQLLNYSLSGIPVPSTLAVTDKGRSVPSQDASGKTNWIYDATANAIRFDPSVFPAPGDDVEITYTIACGN